MTASESGTADGRVRVGQQRRAKTRAAIIAAAFDKFGDQNGLYVSVEEIAEAANVTRATFYNHFAGMAELREALARAAAGKGDRPRPARGGSAGKRRGRS